MAGSFLFLNLSGIPSQSPRELVPVFLRALHHILVGLKEEWHAISVDDPDSQIELNVVKDRVSNIISELNKVITIVGKQQQEIDEIKKNMKFIVELLKKSN